MFQRSSSISYVLYNTKSRLLCIHSIENVVFYILKVVLDDNDDDNELDNNDNDDDDNDNDNDNDDDDDDDDVNPFTARFSMIFAIFLPVHRLYLPIPYLGIHIIVI